MKKTLSLVLAVLMALSIITVAGTSVSAAEAATVNGVDCAVGNTVQFVYSLQTPGTLEDFQGHFEYSEGLKYTGTEMTESKGVMVNEKIDGIIYYSGTSFDTPYDYTASKVLYVATFEVVAPGAQTVKNTMEIVTGSDGTLYYDDGQNNGCTEKADVVVVAVPVSSVVLNKTTATVYTGTKTTLEATVGPELASDKTVTWTSSNEAVATVENGVVTAVKAGTATITAKAGDVEATCVFTVRQRVTSVKLNRTSLLLYNGKSATLRATVYPNDATSKAITWSTTNKKVATVTSGGVVKGVKPGTAYVRATAKDGSKKYGQCKVTVKAQKATKVKLSKKSITLKKKGKKSAKITATLSPTNVYNKTIKVTVDKKKIVKISAKTIKSKKSVKITAKKQGKAKVKFTAKDGSKKSATCTVKVKK